MPGSMFTGYTAPQNNAAYLNMIMQLLEKAGSTIGSVAKSNQQNQVANAFMKQGNSGASAPRAALVDAGPNASQMAAGTPTAGTAPIYPTNSSGQLGGVPELSMAMQLQKQQQLQQQQNMNMQLHQSQMGINNLRQQYLQDYGTENPGAGGNKQVPMDQQSPWGTNNNMPPDHVQKDVATLGSENEKAKTMFGVPLMTLMDPQIQKGWHKADTADVNAPVSKNPDAQWMVNPLLPAQVQNPGPNTGIVSAKDFPSQMGSFSSAWSTHKANRATYKGAYDDYLKQAAGGQYGQQPQSNTPTPPLAGSTGKTSQATPQAPNNFIQSQLPQGPASNPAGNTGAVIPRANPQGTGPVSGVGGSNGYQPPGTVIQNGRVGRILSDGTFFPLQ